MQCRHCHSELILPFLDLGSAPPSNAYLTPAGLTAPELWFPLRLLVCQRCWLVQTEDHAGREALFTQDYAYFSSFSSAWLAHAQAYVSAMVSRLGLGAHRFEFPHLLQLVQQCQFDTVYHEHYSYLSLTAVQTIFAANGLQVFDVEQHPTHGGSLRVLAQRADSGPQPLQPAVPALLAQKQAAGMAQTWFYSQFQPQAIRIKRELLLFLLDCAAKGKTVAGYGAAAKGNTLLNFAGVRADLLPYVVDKNPAKQGKFLPGSRIPIYAPEHLLAQQPDRDLLIGQDCEKIELLTSADAFIAARKLRNALVLEYMHDARTFLESLHAARFACQMFFDIIDNAQAEFVRLGIPQTAHLAPSRSRQPQDNAH